jgi:hypothetical protein
MKEPATTSRMTTRIRIRSRCQPTRGQRLSSVQDNGKGRHGVLEQLALPLSVQTRWPTTVRDVLIKIGSKVVCHAKVVTFQMANVAVPRAVRGRPGSDRPIEGGSSVRPQAIAGGWWRFRETENGDRAPRSP